jgi:hypothetical protein
MSSRIEPLHLRAIDTSRGDVYQRKSTAHLSDERVRRCGTALVLPNGF